jgi:hypothetical protein
VSAPTFASPAEMKAYARGLRAAARIVSAWPGTMTRGQSAREWELCLQMKCALYYLARQVEKGGQRGCQSRHKEESEDSQGGSPHTSLALSALWEEACNLYHDLEGLVKRG